jgi:aminoglycoside 6'-N-acetyltransferase
MHASISFRPLSRIDLPLLHRWLLMPHVVAWWHETLDLAGIHAKYGPRIDGIEPTHVFIIEFLKQPVGLIQWYCWSDYPEHALQLGAGKEAAGIDLALGEQEMVGQGLGPATIRKFINEVVFANPAIHAVIVDVEENNLRSLGAFKKVGFRVLKTTELRGENFRRSIVQLRRPN